MRLLYRRASHINAKYHRFRINRLRPQLVAGNAPSSIMLATLGEGPAPASSFQQSPDQFWQTSLQQLRVRTKNALSLPIQQLLQKHLPKVVGLGLPQPGKWGELFSRSPPSSKSSKHQIGGQSPRPAMQQGELDNLWGEVDSGERRRLIIGAPPFDFFVFLEFETFRITNVLKRKPTRGRSSARAQQALA